MICGTPDLSEGLAATVQKAAGHLISPTRLHWLELYGKSRQHPQRLQQSGSGKGALAPASQPQQSHVQKLPPAGVQPLAAKASGPSRELCFGPCRRWPRLLVVLPSTGMSLGADAAR